MTDEDLRCRHVALNTIVLAACEALGFDLIAGSIGHPESKTVLQLQGARPIVCNPTPGTDDPYVKEILNVVRRLEQNAKALAERDRMLRDVLKEVEAAARSVDESESTGRIGLFTAKDFRAVLGRIRVAAEIPF